MPADAEGFERLFLALMLGEELGGRALAAVRASLGLPAHRSPPGHLRLLGAGDLHLTLFFLGPTARERRAELEGAFAEAFAGLHAPVMELGAGGAFPDPRRPRILWLGVREPEPGALAELEAAARTAAVRLGFRADERPFRPHVTVGRLRPGRAREVPEGFFDLDPGFRWEPAAAALVRSVAGQTGGAYRVERRFPLALP